MVKIEKTLDRQLDLPRTESKLRYLVLSEPRSGSSMLCSALRKSYLAGVPLEYFHANVLGQLGHQLSTEKILAHLRDISERRTTSNGVFGMKLHFNQFQGIFMHKGKIAEDGIEFIKSFSHHVLITRRDKILQSISCLLAQRTGIWGSASSTGEGQQSFEFRTGDVKEIARILLNMVNEEESWLEICRALALRVHRVEYETLVASPETEIGRVFSFLGLHSAYENPETVKQSNDKSREAKRQFLEAIGAHL